MKALATLSLILTSLLFAAPLLADPPEDASYQPACSICGMSRVRFVFSRGLVIWRDDTATPVCSLNCAVVALDEPEGKALSAVFIADYNTLELLRAEKAHWIMGGSLDGVMTTRPKWAFATKEAGREFIGRFGGKVVSYEEAVEQTRAGLMIRRKK